METILLAITIISVLLAIVGLMSARRAQQRERSRSEARVAALSAAADTHGAADGGWQQVSGEWQWTAEPQAVNSDLRIGNPQPQVPGSPATSERFFATVQREESPAGRFPILAAAALIVMLGGALIFLNTPTSNEHAGTVAQVVHNEPLQLVTLGHAGDAASLTISGTVRNPSSGAKLEGLTAVVSLLNRDGALVSTKDVPLDYRALGPGEEAPFKVSIPNPGSIARYRVSFRAGTDVVPHVDRRGDTKLASALQ